jgi:hypothetical protein
MRKMACVFMAVVLAACGVIDLRPIGFQITADGPSGTLAGPYSPVKVAFDCGMVKAETESLISVKSLAGNTDIDQKWEADTLVLRPVQGWSPGITYTVSLSGVIRAEDGREMRVAEYRSFCYGDAEEVPFVISYYPTDGAKTGVTTRNGAFVTLLFSQPMDKNSVQDAFTINGFPDKEYEWNEEASIVTISNKKNIASFEKYSWTLGTSAKSAKGYSIAKEVSAQWTSDAETLKPAVFRIYPVAQKESIYGLEWNETGNPIESGFGDGEAVKIEFTKRMDTADLKNMIRFEPGLSGRIEVINPAKIIFIPERGPVIDTYYTMTISGEAKDENGIKMGEDYLVRFTADIAYLKPVKITVFNKVVLNGGTVEVTLDNIVPEIGISVEFNQAFLDGAQTDCLNQAKLSKIFPSDAPTPVLIFTDWTKGKVFHQVWANFADAAIHGRPYYYKYVIPGGQNGIRNGKGAYLPEDIVFYLNVLVSDGKEY